MSRGHGGFVRFASHMSAGAIKLVISAIPKPSDTWKRLRDIDRREADTQIACMKCVGHVGQVGRTA